VRPEHEEGIDMKHLIAIGRVIAGLVLPEFVIAAIIAAAIGVCLLVFQLDSLPAEMAALVGVFVIIGLVVGW
jgi:hypothetical protein